MFNKTRYKYKSINDIKREKKNSYPDKKNNLLDNKNIDKEKNCINEFKCNNYDELYKTIENLKLCIIDLKQQICNSPSNYNIGKIKLNINNLNNLTVCLNYISFCNTLFIYGSYTNCIIINDLKNTIQLIDSCFNLTCFESSGTIDIFNHNNNTNYNAIILDNLKMEISSRPLIPIGINFHGTINFDIQIHF